jgi:ribosomal protein S18 acetylase RimI-like enzyme
MEQDPSIVVEATDVSLCPQILSLLELDAEQIRLLLTSAAQGHLSMQGLFHARRGEQYVGAAWGQIVPGRTAFTWPPRIGPDVQDSVAMQLQNSVDRYLESVGVTMSQAVLPDLNCIDATRLLAAGYRHFADLDYLACAAVRFPSTQPKLSVEFAVAQESDRLKFTSLIKSTYTNTLDCANLDNIRTMEDTISGYQMTGQYRPNWWLTARHAGTDVGCLIMADHEADQQCELIYMGIIPEARGMGLGRQLVQQALWLTACQKRQRLVLAVDRRNWPARNIYSASGFVAWATRSILLRQFAAT